MSKLEIIKEDPTLESRMENQFLEPLFEWAQENRQKIVWGTLLFFLVLFLLFRVFAGSDSKAEKDYIEASELSKSLFLSGQTEASLKKLKPILARRPELHQEFDALISQAYLNLSLPKESQTYFSKVENRLTEEETKQALESGRIALMIPGENQAAYNQALKFNDSLKETHPTLYTYNLVRIALLEESLGLKKEAVNSWNQLLTLYKKGDSVLTSIFSAIEGEGPSFLSYVQERLNNLNQ